MNLNELRNEYLELWRTMEILPHHISAADHIVDKIVQNAERYGAVEKDTGVPWWWIAAVHSLEGSLNFHTHLHNGDSLQHRTHNVPAGRPADGEPPFTWEASAADALEIKGLDADTEWTVAGALYQFERYNGFGYRTHHPRTLSPYVWSFSNHYAKHPGKYVADGVWDSTAVSEQCGAAVLVRRMIDRGIIEPLKEA